MAFDSHGRKKEKKIHCSITENDALQLLKTQKKNPRLFFQVLSNGKKKFLFVVCFNLINYKKKNVLVLI